LAPFGEKKTTQTIPILIVTDALVMGDYGEGQCPVCALKAGADFFPNKSTEFERVAKLPRGLMRR
jgi:hypothetical protein